MAVVKKRKKKKPEEKDEDELHMGVAVFETEDHIGVAITRPHKPSECAAVREAAEQEFFGHETVFEAKDAASARASVGYSKGYASNFDSVFGKN